MTAGGGDPGEKPGNEGSQPPEDGREATPIEDAPAYGGYESPATPSYPGYGQPSGFPPPGPPRPEFPPPVDYFPSGYPPPEFPPSVYSQYGGAVPPPGYRPPPEFGAPYPGWQSYPPGYTGFPQGGTNKLAIGSIVASVLGLLCCIGSVVGIVLGAVAINQIKRTRQEGYGLAVAGIVVGVATLLISIVWMTFAWN